MRITNNQSWMDVALIASGTIETVFEIAAANSQGITERPTPGLEAVVPTVPVQRITLDYLTENNIKPGTFGN